MFLKQGLKEKHPRGICAEEFATPPQQNPKQTNTKQKKKETNKLAFKFFNWPC